MPVQYIRQRRNRRVSRNVPRHLREFVAQGQAQLKFQIIAHSVVVLLQAARLALPRVLAARRNLEELAGREEKRNRQNTQSSVTTGDGPGLASGTVCGGIPLEGRIKAEPIHELLLPIEADQGLASSICRRCVS